MILQSGCPSVNAGRPQTLRCKKGLLPAWRIMANLPWKPATRVRDWRLPGDSGGVSSPWHAGRVTSGTWEIHDSPAPPRNCGRVGKANCTKAETDGIMEVRPLHVFLLLQLGAREPLDGGHRVGDGAEELGEATVIGGHGPGRAHDRV